MHGANEAPGDDPPPGRGHQTIDRDPAERQPRATGPEPPTLDAHGADLDLVMLGHRVGPTSISTSAAISAEVSAVWLMTATCTPCGRCSPAALDQTFSMFESPRVTRSNVLASFL